MKSKKMGVIIGVDGSLSQIGMYDMSNENQYLWNGELISGPKVGSFLTINQNDIKIIGTVSSEKIIDNQNSIRSSEFDNRYRKNSVNKLIVLKTKGVIEESKFKVTSKYVPMIGNEVSLTSKEELDLIFGIDGGEPCIYMGKSIVENHIVNISIDKFFASHIGIFGNTGSGKSNTLHKLYLQLFRSEYIEQIKSRSQFFVIDFNGEYSNANGFGLNSCDKKIIKISNIDSIKTDKLKIDSDYIIDADVLSVLFDARPATQVPFLRKSISTWKQGNFNEKSMAKYVMGTINKILSTGDAAISDAKSNWIEVAKTYVDDDNLFVELESLEYHGGNKAYKYQDKSNVLYTNDKSNISNETKKKLKFMEIETALSEKYKSLTRLRKLEFHLSFQKVHVSAWKSTNIEHLNPMFNRIKTTLKNLDDILDCENGMDISNEYKTLNIISLVHANNQMTRLVPMLVSKMIYENHKKQMSGKVVNETKHLIMDEAHNILKVNYNKGDDTWQDYRLSIFEEIIKEGRKFGFFLTLSSQRPADISPTILSQLHNYFIHRLVNEKDLGMIENTMPTIDKNSFSMIPLLGQGEAIITGNAVNVPVFVKIEKEGIRPSSDDIILSELWSLESKETDNDDNF